MIRWEFIPIGVLFILPFLLIEIPFSDYDIRPNAEFQFNTMKIPFIKNMGQADDKIKYYTHTFAGSVYITNNDITYLSNVQNNTKWITKEIMLNGHVTPIGHDESTTSINYFKGTSENWKSGIPTYDSVSLGNVWPLIQVELKAKGNNIEKIFTIFPGANVSDIKARFEGISKLEVDENGYLIAYTELGKTVFTKPIAYQMINGKQIDIPISYKINDTTYGFSVEKFDVRIPLVIDPLIASTFIGTSGADTANDIVLDNSGNVYITGETPDVAVDFPTTVGAYDTTENGSTDAFVSKFNSSLSSLSASTFIGGSASDTGYALALDSSGNVYITGYTTDGITDYPTTVGAFNGTHGGTYDAFVSKFNSSLSSLSASTLIGGSGNDYGYDITIDNNSTSVFITGETNAASSNFPTTVGAYDTTHNSSSGTPDAFVSKFNSSLSSLSASTFIGGSGSDSGEAIAVDSSGNVYITGHTADSTTQFPTTGGAYDTTENGSDDAFVSKFNSSLSSLSISTFIGGSSTDAGYAMTIDSSGNVYITGYTTDGSTDYPVTSGVYDTTHNGNDDVFVTKFNGTLVPSASTLIGGSGNDYGYGIAVDSSGNIYITGKTFDSTNDFPTTTGSYDTTHNGSDDAFVSKFNSTLTSLSASTFIGGSDQDYGTGIVVDSSGNVYITGKSTDATTDLPVSTSAYDTTQNGDTDAFVSKFDTLLAPSITNSEKLGLTDTIQLSKSSSTSFSSTATVVPGGEVTVTLPQNTAGSTNTVVIDYPSGVSATTTVSTTTAGSATDTAIKFLGQILDISITGASSSSFTYQIRMTFTDADLSAAGISLSQVKIFQDTNENGSFEQSEALTTTVTTVSAGNYRATADPSNNSKFAIGGVVGQTTANAAAGISAAAGFLGYLKDDCNESGFGKGISLRVYEINYDKCESNLVTILADSTCGPLKVYLERDGNMNLAGMSSNQPYLNNQKRMIVFTSIISSDTEKFTIIAKDKKDEFSETIFSNQCDATKKYTFTTGYTSEQNNSGLLLPTWIKNNAKWWSDSEIDDQTFVNGIQYLVKHDIITVKKDSTTESGSQIIPDWIKNNAKWWANNQIDDQTFVNGIQHLVKTGIIRVD